LSNYFEQYNEKNNTFTLINKAETGSAGEQPVRKKNNTFTLINKAETGSAGEQPVRNNLSNDDENERGILLYPVSKKITLFNMP